MHIEVNQSLQKVAANRTREYFSDEIDWVLNKMQDRFIQLKMRPKKEGRGYTMEEVDLDSVRSLIVSQKSLPAYIDNTRRYKCYLPPDYAYLVSDASYVSELCKVTASEVVSKFYITWLKQVKTTKVNPKFYESIEISANATTLKIPLDLPYYNEYVGYNAKKDIAFIVPWIVNYFQSQGTLISGFETYGDLYKPAHYFFISPDAQPTASLKMDGNINTVLVQELKNLKQHETLKTEQRIDNRLESSENVDMLLSTSFYGPNKRSPVSELSKNILYVYRDDSYTVNRCEITYVRKPRILSLLLGSDCEIAPEFHQTICDMAVEYIKGRLENTQGQQLTERDNELRVII